MAVSQKLTLKEIGVDTLANTSKVKILWTSTQTGESHNDNTRTAKYWITVNGTKTEYTVSYTLPAKTTKTILSKTITVPHREDGTGTVKVQTWMDTRISAGEVELSKSLTLTAIARASTIGATDAFIESTSIIGINRKSEAYTHSVEFSFGDLIGYIDDAGAITDVEVKHTGTSIPFLITPLFYEYMTDKSSETCQLVCRTYDGDTEIGSKEASFTIKADPELCKPVITCDVKDVNQKTVDLTGDADTLVRYVSTARCTISADALNGATIKTMKVNGNETSDTFDISGPESGEFVFSAEDSRGLVAEKAVTKTLIPYIPLTLNVKVTRTDPTSGKAILSASGQCYGGSFGAKENTISFVYSINGSERKAAEVKISEDGFQYSVEEKISGLEYMSTSSVDVVLSDSIRKETHSITVKPGIPVFDWGESDFAFHVPVSMTNHAITDLPQPEADADAVPKSYADRKPEIRKLWINPNPNSEFEAQEINLDLSAASGVSIFFRDESTGSLYLNTGFIPNGYKGSMRYTGESTGLTYRHFTVNEGGIVFEAGVCTKDDTSNIHCIPIEISAWYSVDGEGYGVGTGNVGCLPAPIGATVGQYIRVKSLNENGGVVETEAVTRPTIVPMTQEEYDALVEKDDTVLYMIVRDE